MTAVASPWWRDGVIYQIYVRSFADSNGDGVGDLEGVIERLDHLRWLGVDAIWLSPINPSPNADWGYDVSDYLDVDPALGDLATFDRLVAESSRRGLRVILDLVPNHTSDRHPWFVDARRDRSAPHRDWYVWSDARDGRPPNNWMSTFGGPAWTWDDATGQYYFHNFLAQQPDLNWWNEDVRAAFDEILRRWFDRGVAGFRIDVAHGLVKDRELRDNPDVTDDDHPHIRSLGLRPIYNMNRPEVHEIYRRWRELADAYDPPRLLIGETWQFDMPTLMTYYGAEGAELHLPMNFLFPFSRFPDETRDVVVATEAALPKDAWPVWVASNHDVGRFPTRWCGGDQRKIRAALLTLLTLRGTPILYYGDEIGMVDVEVPREALRDPVGLAGWPEGPGRDPGRTPMRWDPGPGAGFTTSPERAWLPIGDGPATNVAAQRDDPASVLHLCRDLLAIRRATPDLATGAWAPLSTTAGVWAWRRGEGVVVAVNPTETPASVETGPGRVLLATERARDGEEVGRELTLGPWEAVVLRRAPS
jgi:alpha-glucosidase